MKRSIMLLFVVLLGLSWYLAISETMEQPKKVQECLEKATKLEEKGIYVDAVAEYEEALKYTPDDADIYNRMADAYLKSGNTNKFTATCQKTAETFQEDTEALDRLMEYYQKNGYEDRAVKYLTDFLESYPKNENAGKWFSELKGSYSELYCRYEEMGDMVNNSIVVMEEGLYGIVNDEGKEIIETKYEELHPFSEDGFALARNEDGGYIYIDRDGQIRKVPEACYEDLGMIGSNRTVASRDGKYGYLDEEMEPIGEFIWEELSGICNNTGAAKKDAKWVLLNKKGEEKTEEQYDDVILDENGFCSCQKRIFVRSGKEYYLIDQKGKRIGELSFEDAKAFTENGNAAVCKGGKWGFVNTKGELVIDYLYEDARSFQNGYAAVCMDGMWGYIDMDGAFIVDSRFSEASCFSESGTAAVKEKENGEEEWKLIRLNIFS